MTRVLVVEDDPDIREVLVDALQDDGYDVDWAEDGLTGLRIALENRPTLAIIDMMLPGLSGREFLHQCRADPGCASMKIIVVTAFHDIGVAEVDADAVIHKPFSLGPLMDAVAELAPQSALEGR